MDDASRKFDTLVREQQELALEIKGLENDGDAVGRCAWAILELPGNRLITMSMSVEGLGPIGSPWDQVVGDRAIAMIEAFNVPPDALPSSGAFRGDSDD